MKTPGLWSQSHLDAAASIKNHRLLLSPEIFPLLQNVFWHFQTWCRMIGTRERIGRWPKAEWKAEECETKMSATDPKTLIKPLKNRPLLETAGHEDWCPLSAFLFFFLEFIKCPHVAGTENFFLWSIEDPQTERGATFFRPRPHHWFPRWHQRWSYKYPPHVLIEECVCFNWNAKAHTHVVTQGDCTQLFGAYSTVNIVSQIENRHTNTR